MAEISGMAEESKWNQMSMTNALFGFHLDEIIERWPDLRIITADMSYIASLELFKAKYPDKFINVGISEQNMIGVAAGLASEGFKCVCLAQACFITMRCFDQVRQFMSYMDIPLILVGLASGFSLQFMGNSHYALEDIGLMRSIPGIDIYSPSDSEEAVKIFDYVLSSDRPAYIRLATKVASVNSSDYNFSPSVYPIFKDGKDVVILATGSMVSAAIEVADNFKEKGIDVGVISIPTISPFNSAILEELSCSRLIVTIEEHGLMNGLGTLVRDLGSEIPNFPKVLKLGVKGYSKVGDYDYLLSQNNLTVPQIIEDILKAL